MRRGARTLRRRWQSFEVQPETRGLRRTHTARFRGLERGGRAEGAGKWPTATSVDRTAVGWLGSFVRGRVAPVPWWL
jgi:hypothetical protein